MIINTLHCFFAAETWPGRIFKAVMMFIGIFAIIPFGLIILPACGRHGSAVLIKRSASEKAKELGLSEDLLMLGDEISALIDKTKQKILFVSRVDHSLYSFSDILEWEWQWVETNGKKSNSHIAFKLNDEKMPLIKVGTLNSDDAERWHTRIGLILNPV